VKKEGGFSQGRKAILSNKYKEKWRSGMAESVLMVKSKAFALEVIRACRVLREARCESALINQFLRSGTSIGANIHEAFYAQGKADFIAKLHIALKECSETEYWLELLIESGYYSDRTILDRCIEVKRILIASINTAKENNHA
jgi:four helix bundle protein